MGELIGNEMPHLFSGRVMSKLILETEKSVEPRGNQT